MLSNTTSSGIGLGVALLLGTQAAALAQGLPADSGPVAAPTSPPSSAAASVAAPYRLVQVAGKPLPALVDKEWRCEEYVTAGTLTLAPDSTWTLQSTKRETCGDQTKNDLETDHGRYALEGQSIRFVDDDDDSDDNDRDTDDLDDLQTAVVDGGGKLTVTLDDGRTTLVFRR